VAYSSAIQKFELARATGDVRALADGLIEMIRYIDTEFNKIDREIKSVERKLR